MLPQSNHSMDESSENIYYDRRYLLISMIDNGIICVSSPFRSTHFFNEKRPWPSTRAFLLHENDRGESKTLCLVTAALFTML